MKVIYPSGLVITYNKANLHSIKSNGVIILYYRTPLEEKQNKPGTIQCIIEPGTQCIVEFADNCGIRNLAEPINTKNVLEFVKSLKYMGMNWQDAENIKKLKKYLVDNFNSVSKVFK